MDSISGLDGESQPLRTIDEMAADYVRELRIFNLMGLITWVDTAWVGHQFNQTARLSLAWASSRWWPCLTPIASQPGS